MQTNTGHLDGEPFPAGLDGARADGDTDFVAAHTHGDASTQPPNRESRRPEGGSGPRRAGGTPFPRRMSGTRRLISGAAERKAGTGTFPYAAGAARATSWSTRTQATVPASTRTAIPSAARIGARSSASLKTRAAPTARLTREGTSRSGPRRFCMIPTAACEGRPMAPATSGCARLPGCTASGRRTRTLLLGSASPRSPNPPRSPCWPWAGLRRLGTDAVRSSVAAFWKAVWDACPHARTVLD